MEGFFWSNILNASQVTGSSKEEESSQCSQKKNVLITSSKSDEYCSSNSSISLNLSSVSNNIFFNDINQNNPNVNNNAKTIAEPKNKNIFLGKKRKIHFDVIKKGYKKPFFRSYNIDNISLNIANKEEIRQNSNSLESTSSNEKSKTSELQKNKKVKLFNTYIDDVNNYPKQNLKEGRWSYDEQIRFIIAFVKFGKNYKLIQKYISSRKVPQIISHAQKFFKRLKQIKNNEYDFTNDNIKNLFDIFDIIENNNKTTMNNKEYIINTLISLCEEENKSKKKEDIIIQIKEEKTLEELFPNNMSDIDMEKIIYENEEIKKDNTYSKEIDIYNIIERETNKESQEQDNYVDHSCIDNLSNNKIYEDNAFLSNDFDIICSDEISLEANNNIYNFYKKRKMPYLNYYI